MRSKKDKMFSMVMGGVVGDASGVPYEFKDRKSIADNPCVDMIGFGTHDQPIGTWSDDTSLTLVLIDSLKDGIFDINKFGNNSINWLNCYSYTPHGEVFDIGISTSNSLNKLQMGFSPESCGGTSIKDNGNGALMRIHPLLKLVKLEMNIGDKYELVKSASCLTHNHPISHLSCLFYIEFLLHLYHDFNKTYSYNKTIDSVADFIDSREDLIEYKSLFNRLFNDISSLPEDEVLSSGYVVHTLEAAMWCFLKGLTFKESVLKAVNLGSDTDTTASVTGCMAGMYYGWDQIPSDWISNLVQVEYIVSYANKISSNLE